MSIDMKQFHAVFFEESQEHLDEMEQLLLELDVNNPDHETLNSIFRAAHSIKGGSGIFSFDALTSVTHIMENLLDKIRQGKMKITKKMVYLFLHSNDQLKDILDSYRRHEAIDWAVVHKLTRQLEEITAGNKSELNDDAYGFFENPILGKEDDAFGFFDETTKDETFGFFEKESPIAEIQPIVAAKSLHGQSAITELPIEATSASLRPAVKNKSNDHTTVESSSIRVDITKVDQLINLVGEIVITQSMMSLIGKSLEGDLAEKFQAVSSELERNTREIQEAVMSIRMLPVSFVFNRFPRVVRDLSSKLGKQIDLIIEGGDTELDKGLTEKLVDPLTHLVRNSIDHGIEATDVRIASGKNPTGTVTLTAAQQGGIIVISISDDGSGLNRERIIAKAKENNIPVNDAAKDEEIWQLIFAPGFSTATQVTDVSGRGVGMDVVRRNVQSLSGHIDIQSRAGMGTTITIRLPLTLAIVDGMCVSVGSQTFIVPLVNIVESMRAQEKDIKTLAGDDQLLHVRNEYWPILSLYKSMQLEPVYTEVGKGIVVLVETNKHRFGLFVDSLVGQQQVVIKSLEQHYKRVQGIAGATIMGDGSVALIVDVESLALSLNPTSISIVA
jgi:two-component system chemotaxis sensor kinase CheA